MARIVKDVPDHEAELARRALVSVRHALESHENVEGLVSLSVEGEVERVEVPKEAVDLLVRILANMAAGQGVSIIPRHAELTSQQAAEILNVSRPFLLRLLDRGVIDFRLVGTHRRIRAESLMRYKAEDDARARAALAELISLDQDSDR
jgi:excisionase family DNA binding protein